MTDTTPPGTHNDTHNRAQARTTITPAIESRILELFGTGLSGNAIAQTLDITPSTVNRFLKDHRRERSEQTKALVREHLAVTLPSDLELLDRATTRLSVLMDATAESGDVHLELKVLEQLRKNIDTKLKNSGSQEDDSAARLIEALSAD